jgi:hypothetical protein
MADLLRNLEQGITRNVGAASRLRTQIATIDNYMILQRQGGVTFGSNGLPAPSPFLTTSGNNDNPNIDPSLQNAQANNTYQASANPYNYSSGPAVSGVGGGMSVSAGEQFQLPPQLLEGWPWPFDITQGLGGF